MCGFDDILTKASSLVDREDHSYPKEIQHFISYMEETRVATEIAKNENVRDRNGIVGSQKSGSHVQDKISLRNINEDTFDNENCVSCHRCFPIPIDRDIDMINTYNKKIENDHTIAVSKWGDTTK